MVMFTNMNPLIERAAIFDITGSYRYSLRRCWHSQVNSPEVKVVFVMLNPSCADAQQDDPTLRACMSFAQRWGYCHLEVVNLFAYCTAYPKNLQTVLDPIGPQTDHYLLTAVTTAHKIILAWGNGGKLWDRDKAVLARLRPYRNKLFCLGMTQSAQPRHPLYVRRCTVLVRWRGHRVKMQ